MQGIPWNSMELLRIPARDSKWNLQELQEMRGIPQGFLAFLADARKTSNELP